MTLRLWLIVWAGCGVLFLSGCQRSTARPPKADFSEPPKERAVRQDRKPKAPKPAEPQAPAAVEADKQPARRVRNNAEKPKQADQKAPASPEAAGSPKTRTVRMRDAKTGRTVTKRVPVEPGDKQGDEPVDPGENKFTIHWKQACSVEQAFEVCQDMLTDLNLKIAGASSRTVRTRDPRLGRTVEKKVPVAGGYKDGLSASLQATSSVGIDYTIEIVLLPPDSCRVLLAVESDSQPAKILEEHALYLNQEIKRAIQQVLANPVQGQTRDDICDVIVLDQDLAQSYEMIYQWSRKWRFNRKESEGDSYSYKKMRFETGSEIEIVFFLRMLEQEKTKVEIEMQEIAGKDESAVIWESLKNTLLGKEDAALPSYAETRVLSHPVGKVMEAVRLWATSSGMNWEGNRDADVFYASGYCYSASGIRFALKVRLIEPDTASLQITADNWKDKPEFDVMMKALNESLKQLESAPAKVAERSVN